MTPKSSRSGTASTGNIPKYGCNRVLIYFSKSTLNPSAAPSATLRFMGTCQQGCKLGAIVSGFRVFGFGCHVYPYLQVPTNLKVCPKHREPTPCPLALLPCLKAPLLAAESLQSPRSQTGFGEVTGFGVVRFLGSV